ncbi:MAG: carbon storage regulator CsrA [Deltaproteobacteria bacterium]|nr:carbon storage regulator CsrA [Deltaproteobacteria bacterium]
MLTVTRRAGQTIRIGDHVKITIKEVRGRQVRLMIEAPRDVRVYREELYQQIAQENEAAARVDRNRLGELE